MRSSDVGLGGVARAVGGARPGMRERLLLLAAVGSKDIGGRVVGTCGG